MRLKALKVFLSSASPFSMSAQMIFLQCQIDIHAITFYREDDDEIKWRAVL